MATINVVNNTLTSSSGTGSFVGSADPVLTAADFGGATTLKIPNGNSPTLSTAGDLAVDNSITNFNGMLKYRDSTQTLLGISIPFADLASATNGQLIGYSSASSKMTLITPSSTPQVIAGYASASSTADDTTTSTSAVNTSLTVTYTPTNASNLLLIEVHGVGICTITSGTSNQRYATYIIRRTSGSAADLATVLNGRASRITTSAAEESFYNVSFFITETAGNTSAHTYILQHDVNVSGGSTTFSGSLCKAFMVVTELKV